MQLSAAKSLSKKLRTEKFFEEGAISCFSTHEGEGFCATAGRGPLGESTGEQFFLINFSLTKHSSILHHILDED